MLHFLQTKHFLQPRLLPKEVHERMLWYGLPNRYIQSLPNISDDLPDRIIDVEQHQAGARTILTSQLVAGTASLLALSAVEA